VLGQVPDEEPLGIIKGGMNRSYNKQENTANTAHAKENMSTKQI